MAKSKAEEPETPRTDEPEKPPPAEPTLLDRLAVLERQGRRLKRLLILLVVLAVLATAAAAAALVAPHNAKVEYWIGQVLGRPEVVESQKKIVEAEQLVLRAPDGKVRATIGLRDHNAMGIDFFDANGRGRMGLDLGDDGEGSLWLAAEDGQVGLGVNMRGLRIVDPARGTMVLAAPGLSIVDRDQKPRLGLTVKDDQRPTLTLYDGDGRTGALVDVSADGSRLGLFHAGVPRAGIGYGRGGAQLNLFGDDGRDHATLGLMPDGSAGLLFHDQDGKQRVALGVLSSSVSGLSVYDKSEKHRAGLSVTDDGVPHLELYDAAGTRRAGLTLSADGLPGLQLEDRGQPRAILGAGDGKRGAASGRTPSPSSLLLLDKDGSVVFQAPVY